LRLRVSFYVILVFTMTAFAWWTYSLIKLSYEVHIYDNDVLGFQVHQATNTVLQNSKFKPDDDTAFARMKLGRHAIYFDTVQMREMVTAKHPYTEIVYNDSMVSLVPAPDIVEKLEDEKYRKVTMYIIEGVVFLLLLMVGFSWIYNRLNSIIKLNQQKSNFLLAVTHELKTPMASVKLFLQTIQRRDLSREQLNPMISNCIDDVDRLNDLAENMLLATRIEGNSYQYNFEEMDLSALLSGICENYEKKYEATYRFEEEIEQDIELTVDVFSITMAINNLIENALKYSPPNTTITLALKRDADRVFLEVRDEGPGVPKEERHNIFNKFYRLGNESTRTTKGTGLGLYIVKETAEHHKATAEVLENKPKGSIFRIIFKATTTR
jgi:two-component system, OmpR family, phosphate regulon sensor histidine kinase PhoR